MISIDTKKTVIAGEAIEIVTEMAAVIDRIFEEISKKSNNGTARLSYNDVQDKFMDLLVVMRDIRNEAPDDIHPHLLIDHPRVRELFPESAFGLSPSNQEEFVRGNADSTDAEDLLKKAMLRLGKVKSKSGKNKDKDKTKSKKNKGSKKSKGSKND